MFQTVVITGATAGIGKETARDLANRGAKVLILARNERRGEDTVKELSENDVEVGQRVQFRSLDLGSLASVRECARGILESEQKIDILINNAGKDFVKQR